MTQKLEIAAVQLYKIIFNSIASSLFKSDRLMFGIHLVHGIFPDLFQAQEWEFLLGMSAVSLESRI